MRYHQEKRVIILPIYNFWSKMKYILIFIFTLSLTFGMKITQKNWKSGDTFSEYLDSHNIPYSLLKSISQEDTKFLTEIQRDAEYYELIDNSGNLIQALIPLNEEMQIHLVKDRDTHKYSFDIIPISYKKHTYFAHLKIQSNPSNDTQKVLNQAKIAKRIGQVLKNTLNTRNLQKGDELSFYYHQKTRLGYTYHMPKIEVVSIKSRGKTKFIYADEDGYGHKEKGKLISFTKKGDLVHKKLIRERSDKFNMPLRRVRVTSSFSYRRWHPILHRYRPHHGTDFGARRGVPLLAVYSGRVSFAGWMGGYGKVVKIKHPKGYESLYAHQSRIKVKKGQRVKKGQIIGYVGSTGRSTGPHLHFGLKKRGRWVDPMKVLKRAIPGKKKYSKLVIKDAKKKKKKLIKFMEQKDKSNYVWKNSKFGLYCIIKDNNATKHQEL